MRGMRMVDARFDDGEDKPLYLAARDTDDLAVLSALVQDSVFPATEIVWQAKQRRLALLLNRFRWEDKARAEARARSYERVQSMLVIEDVVRVRSQGIDRSDADLVLSLMSVGWAAGEDGAGQVELVLAGDGAIALEAECLDVTLRDVTRPYAAPSGKAPDHGA